MEYPKRVLLWLCITTTLLPNVINEPLGSWTANMRPGSLVGEIKNILANELKNRIAGGIMTAMGAGPGHMNTAGGGHTASSLLGSSSTMMSSLLGGQMHGGQMHGGARNYAGGMPGGSFEDYLRGGLRMHATIAIDFTTFNGHQSMPTSLHFLNPQGLLNNYEEAIGSVIGTIEAYDWDNRFQVFGFGAQYPRQNMVSHDFNLNPDFSECMGVQGVLDTYRRCLSNIEFSRPALFAPIVSKVVQSARPFDQDNYYLLIILTAGQIEDIDLTESVIAQGSTLPLSIMIVGIGNGPFQYMVRLDNDVRSTLRLHRKEMKNQSGYYNTEQYRRKPKKDKKNKMLAISAYGGAMDPMNGWSGTSGLGAAVGMSALSGLGLGAAGGMSALGGLGGMNRRKHRDIVQFVPFNAFRTYGADNVARVQFAQELIAELPFQVESYMRSHNYMPRPPDPNRPLRAGQTLPGHGIPGNTPGSAYVQSQMPFGGIPTSSVNPSLQHMTPQAGLYSGTSSASPYMAIQTPSHYQNSSVAASQQIYSQQPNGVTQFAIPSTHIQGQNPYGTSTFQQSFLPTGAALNMMPQPYPPHSQPY